LYFKGFQSLQLHRVGHVLWGNGRRELATYLQSRVSEIFQVDIHPAARFGVGVFIDHATGIVVGETATVGDNVSILQDVTLGGTGKESGDRHPKVGDGVLLAAGAKVLGNITIGEGAKIGAGSVVLKPVPPHTTVAGIPATIVGRSINMPALTMDQEFAVDFQI
jgi:serine O-acetyltransferase